VTEDLTRWSDGRTSSRSVQRPRVSIDEWMNALEPGDAWLRVAPIDRGWRQERVRVALPRDVPTSDERAMVRITTSDNTSDNGSDSKANSARRHYPNEAQGYAPRVSALAAVPPECPAELLTKIGADILAKCDRRWSRKHHELGPCLVWTGPQTTDNKGRTYGRFYDAAIGRTDYTHRVVWRRCFGPIARGVHVDHLCEITLCQRPDHFDGTTRAENTRRRHQRAGATAETSSSRQAVQRFAVALFAGVDRTTFDSRSLSLAELRQMLSRFEVLADKRRGRCWSPTEYAPGHTTRSNAGVAAVSALVFDCDRVPLDAERLAGVYWLGHTTWSHTPTGTALARGHSVVDVSASCTLARCLAARTCSAVPRGRSVLERPEPAVLTAQPQRRRHGESDMP
jgi:hypothetical protein